MSKISVTTIAGLTSGGDANTVKIESGDAFNVVSGATTLGGDLTVDTTTLKVDASNNRTIMGYSSGRVPTSVIVPHVNSSIAPAMRITTHGNAGYSSSNSQGAGARLEFGQYDDGYDWITGSIASTRTGSNWGGDLVFSTNNNSASNNQTETMRINRDGHITTPNVPAFHAKGLSNSASSAGTSGTGTLVFGSATVNNGSHYNTSNGRFTAPIAGLYYIAFSVLYDDSYNNNGSAYLRKNGSGVGEYAYAEGGAITGYIQTAGSAVVTAAAGDYIEVYTGITGWHVGSESSFTGFLIG
jgi:hypothetical protein|tara:strand:- start:2174 stop:3067 length:894 start_codon:yes stop_codon:yes gene_type:complete